SGSNSPCRPPWTGVSRLSVIVFAITVLDIMSRPLAAFDTRADGAPPRRPARDQYPGPHGRRRDRTGPLHRAAWTSLRPGRPRRLLPPLRSSSVREIIRNSDMHVASALAPPPPVRGDDRRRGQGPRAAAAPRVQRRFFVAGRTVFVAGTTINPGTLVLLAGRR